MSRYEDESPAWLLVAVVLVALFTLSPVVGSHPARLTASTPAQIGASLVQPESDVAPRLGVDSDAESPTDGAPIPTQDPGELTSSIESGIATWFDDGAGFYAAVPTWHWGDEPYAITVCRQDKPGVCVPATVRDFCQCPGARIVDLSPLAFSKLAPLWAGLVKVTLQRAGSIPLPATDKETP
jgi:hypothetical protein